MLMSNYAPMLVFNTLKRFNVTEKDAFIFIYRTALSIW